MVSYSNVKQGTGYIFGTPEVGKDGAAPCLAIYLYHVDHGVFVAHADCVVQIVKPSPKFDYVSDELAKKLAAALGPFDGDVHTDIQCFSGGMDRILMALR